jgi:hypothetical protein
MPFDDFEKPFPFQSGEGGIHLVPISMLPLPRHLANLMDRADSVGSDQRRRDEPRSGDHRKHNVLYLYPPLLIHRTATQSLTTSQYNATAINREAFMDVKDYTQRNRK